MSIDLTGQTALITGGATGLGFAIAAELGKAGARIALNDLSREQVDAACKRLVAAGRGVCRVRRRCARSPGDRGDGAGHRGSLGAPDIVVANAGIYPNTPFLEIAEAEWDNVFDINVKGTFLTCQAAARSMVAAGRRNGRMVVISSGAANAALWGWSHYCASKAAVAMLARSMALELAEHGIRVNAVLPGYIDVEEGGRTSTRHTSRPPGMPSPSAGPAHRRTSPGPCFCSSPRSRTTSTEPASSSMAAAAPAARASAP